jgi:glycosyltransferase involved in cell wall biosynthesis
MRIGMVAPPWIALPPAGYGGIELVVSDLTEELVRRGEDVLLFAPGDSRSAAQVYSTVPRQVGQSWPWEIGALLFWSTSAYAYARAMLEEVALVHDHTLMETDLAVLRLHTLHGPATPEVVDRCRLIGASGRDYFAAISHRQRALYGEDLPWAGVVHNGINVEAAPFSAEKEDYLVFVGRANWEKGLDLAIRVAMRAGKRLVMAVKMTEEHEHAYYAEHVDPWLRRGGRIELLGEITPVEKFALFHNAAGTLFTSQWEEPFGLIMPESLACGTPVLALRRGAAPEVIEDGVTGFLAEDEDGLVAAVARLREIDPHACRARAAALFSVEAMAEGYLHLYQQVCERAGARSAVV